MSSSRPSLRLDNEGYFLPTPRFPTTIPTPTKHPYRPPVDKPLPATHIDWTAPALSMSGIIPREHAALPCASDWPQNTVPDSPAPEGFGARFAAEHQRTPKSQGSQDIQDFQGPQGSQGSDIFPLSSPSSSGCSDNPSSPPTNLPHEEMIEKNRGYEEVSLQSRVLCPRASSPSAVTGVKGPHIRSSSAPPVLGR